ncbi:protein kinase domain-containing protein [Posidoniimonas polymericola]|uniref:protein kinase domain-containing protein n=1 Tax=Posidoniimonas polymericola TaxID=2528002 RepID=UPI0011B407BE|nr:protein kinase [Posidoniimonas polymericola]
MINLQQLVERVGPLDHRRAARYALNAALQLEELHRQGGVHRDVRPTTLVLDHRGNAELVAAAPAPAISTLTYCSDAELPEVLPCVDYLAPEAALSSERADHRRDIYSLGCVLYFLLTGRPPFAAGSVSERLLCHQVTPPPAIAKSRADTPAILSQLCAKMMSKKPRDRPQSALEVAETLRGWLKP